MLTHWRIEFVLFCNTYFCFHPLGSSSRCARVNGWHVNVLPLQEIVGLVLFITVTDIIK